MVKLGLIALALLAFALAGNALAMRLGFSDLHRMTEFALPYVLIIFVLAAAIPFVPGAEIGLGLLMLLGAEVAFEVYFAMLLALLLAFCVGRSVPPKFSQKHLQYLRTRLRLFQIRRSVKSGKSAHFVAGAFRLLTANKYLTLGTALNAPGNSLLGGGGGLAVMAGVSRQFTFAEFGLTASIAVMPVPLTFLILG